MKCEKCGNCGNCRCCVKGTLLCPVSLGFAIGITSGLGVLIWGLWAMYHGVTPMMEQFHIPVPTFKDASMHAFWALIKGFVFGFFVALFYDLFRSLCSKCCRKKSDTSESGAPSAGNNN